MARPQSSLQELAKRDARLRRILEDEKRLREHHAKTMLNLHAARAAIARHLDHIKSQREHPVQIGRVRQLEKELERLTDEMDEFDVHMKEKLMHKHAELNEYYHKIGSYRA